MPRAIYPDSHPRMRGAEVNRVHAAAYSCSITPTPFRRTGEGTARDGAGGATRNGCIVLLCGGLLSPCFWRSRATEPRLMGASANRSAPPPSQATESPAPRVSAAPCLDTRDSTQPTLAHIRFPNSTMIKSPCGGRAPVFALAVGA